MFTSKQIYGGGLAGNSRLVAAVLWVAVFALYLPAANAGFVADFTGWLEQMQRYGFWDNINRTHYRSNSLFQVTQLVTWVFYQFFGTHAWPWHLLHVTLHAANGLLLYLLCRRLYTRLGVNTPGATAFLGALLFCLSVNAAEVVVWEPAFHFAQGLLFILLILNWCLKYLDGGGNKWLFYSVFVYAASSFTLEVFYITPILVALLALLYRLTAMADATTLKQLFTRALLPMAGVLVVHFALVKMVYGAWMPHLAGDAVVDAPQAGIGKPAKVLFNMLFLGRFWAEDTKMKVYALLDSRLGIGTFYTLLTGSALFLLSQIKKAAPRTKAMAMLFAWLVAFLLFLVPLWFEPMFLMVFDRYTYFTGAVLYAMVALALGYIPGNYIPIGVLGLYTLVQVRYTIQVNRYWMKSARVIYGLLHSIPPAGNKTIILLNLPQNMHGIPMIGAEHESEFKLMYNGLYPASKLSDTVYDALAYNMLTPDDGATVTIINDSTLRVTLNQWGTWWWFGMRGAKSYSTPHYTINLIDPGHYYDLILRQPHNNYMLLYQQGNSWHQVKWN